MAILHAQSGEVVDIRPLGSALTTSKTIALIKTRRFEVIRMVLLAGKEIAEHKAKGDIIVQCLEGHVVFTAMGESVELPAGQMFYLNNREPHSLRAMEDSSLLLTLLLISDAT